MPLFRRQSPPSSSAPLLPENAAPILRKLEHYKPEGQGIYRTYLSWRHLHRTPKSVTLWLIKNASDQAERGAPLELVVAMLERARHNALQCSWTGDTAQLLLQIARLQLKVGLMECAGLEVKFQMLDSSARTLDVLDQTVDGFLLPGRRVRWRKSIEEVRKVVHTTRLGVWEPEEDPDGADDEQKDGPA